MRRLLPVLVCAAIVLGGVRLPHRPASLMDGIAQVVTPVTLHAQGWGPIPCDEAYARIQQAAQVDPNVYVIEDIDLGTYIYGVDLHRLIVNTTGGSTYIDCLESQY